MQLKLQYTCISFPYYPDDRYVLLLKEISIHVQFVLRDQVSQPINNGLGFFTIFTVHQSTTPCSDNRPRRKSKCRSYRKVENEMATDRENKLKQQTTSQPPKGSDLCGIFSRLRKRTFRVVLLRHTGSTSTKENPETHFRRMDKPKNTPQTCK